MTCIYCFQYPNTLAARLQLSDKDQEQPIKGTPTILLPGVLSQPFLDQTTYEEQLAGQMWCPSSWRYHEFRTQGISTVDL